MIVIAGEKPMMTMNFIFFSIFGAIRNRLFIGQELVYGANSCTGWAVWSNIYRIITFSNEPTISAPVTLHLKFQTVLAATTSGPLLHPFVLFISLLNPCSFTSSAPILSCLSPKPISLCALAARQQTSVISYRTCFSQT